MENKKCRRHELYVEECKNLTSIPNLKGWDVSNVNNMNYMFSNCLGLKVEIDLSGWKPKKTCQIDGVFNNCPVPISL